MQNNDNIRNLSHNNTSFERQKIKKKRENVEVSIDIVEILSLSGV